MGTEPVGPWAAIVLAAGLSSRMRGFKPLYPLGRGTVVERVAAMFFQAGVRNVLVVAGHRAGDLAPVVESAGARVFLNPDFAKGMFTSVQAGAAALAPDVRGFFVMPVDIPLVRAETVARLMRSWPGAGTDVLHPTFMGERGHPPLIARDLAAEVAAWPGKGGLRGLLADLEARRPGRSREVPVADANILLDMDTEDAYRRVLGLHSRLGAPSEEECLAAFDLAGTPEAVREHGRAVAAVAVAMALGLNRTGQGPALDADLVASAALVHDLAKGHPRHEAEGGRLLAAMGFGDIAGMVAGHRDMSPASGEPVSEAELVFMADKVVAGTRAVALEERYGRVLERHKNDPEAVAAITGRLSRARAVMARLESLLGRSVEEIAGEVLKGARQ